MMKRKKKRNTIHSPMVSRKYKIGQRVIGKRSPNKYAGELVRTYCTLNNGYRNAAYVVKCDTDGKERSFQVVGAE
jgi:hypothetical protein